MEKKFSDIEKNQIIEAFIAEMTAWGYMPGSIGKFLALILDALEGLKKK